MTTVDAHTADAHTADAQAEAIQAAVQAAIRAESGEFIFLTRAEVSAFVNALPADVRVRWQAEPTVMFSHHYRVTFWRSLWRGGKKASVNGEDSQP